MELESTLCGIPKWCDQGSEAGGWRLIELICFLKIAASVRSLLPFMAD